MTDGGAQMSAPAQRRVTAFVLGPTVVRRLALTHVLDDFAVAFINVSLLGSLFVNVSVHASRSRIIAYLLLTALPLAVTAPLLGRALDRWHADARAFIVGSQLVRAGVAVAMIPLRFSLAMYPLAFVVLASKKVYSLTKSTVLTTMATTGDELVAADSHLARWGSVVGSAGSAIGAAFVALDQPTVLLVCAIPAFAAAGWAAAGLTPGPERARSARQPTAGLRTVLPVGMVSATWAVTALRAASGALTYLLAFAVKRGGAERWIYAVGLVAAGAGAMLSTVVAPRILRRHPPDVVIVWAIFVPALVATLGIPTIGQPVAMLIALSIGLGNGVASRSITLFEARVPLPGRGRAIARTELIFQLATVFGAAAAVQFAPEPGVGFLVTSIVLGVVAIAAALHMAGPARRARGSATARSPEAH